MCDLSIGKPDALRPGPRSSFLKSRDGAVLNFHVVPGNVLVEDAALSMLRAILVLRVFRMFLHRPIDRGRIEREVDSVPNSTAEAIIFRNRFIESAVFRRLLRLSQKLKHDPHRLEVLHLLSRLPPNKPLALAIEDPNRTSVSHSHIKRIPGFPTTEWGPSERRSALELRASAFITV